ncbi:hypothetical protein BV898_09898 [Hypsibius exemplaris]|uniref:Uncharacterized protein n=1 Tax=Hypsibius exemplaris TaxID=2072580 RepID=A0A1W0WLE0_HYPEX|nr:hypothetical protein BV898_09898 [Hypsibius exemplaris]
MSSGKESSRTASPPTELVVHTDPLSADKDEHDPILKEITSADGQRKVLLIPCYKLTIKLECVLGLLLVLSQMIVSVLIFISNSNISSGYTVDKGFPGVWSGLSVMAFAYFAHRVALVAKDDSDNSHRESVGLMHFARRVSMKAHFDPEETFSQDPDNLLYFPWRGMSISRTLLIVGSIGTMTLLTFGLACAIVGLTETTAVLQAATAAETTGVMLAITAVQAFSVAPFGLLALFLTIQIITATGIFSYQCCTFCYPVSVFTDWERMTKPLIIFRQEDLPEKEEGSTAIHV